MNDGGGQEVFMKDAFEKSVFDLVFVFVDLLQASS